MIPSGDVVLNEPSLQQDIVSIWCSYNYLKSVVKSLLIIKGWTKIAYYLLGILKDSRIDTKVIEVNQEELPFFSEKFLNFISFKGMWNN